MDLLGPAIATISLLNNSEIVSIACDYAGIEEIRREVLQEAVKSANASAAATASAFGTLVAGVHRLKYQISGLDNNLKKPRNTLSKMKRSKVADTDVAAVSDGLRLAHTVKSLPMWSQIST